MRFAKLQLHHPTTKLIIFVFLFFSVSCNEVYAQGLLKGKIIYAKDAKPAAFASVKLINHAAGSVSDATGNFSLVLPALKSTDTLLITSIGYENLKIPAQKAALLTPFILLESLKTLDAVIIRSFSKEEITGTKSEIVGYYRSWDAEKTGGEIGRTFSTTHKEYQIAKVKFKVYNTYDTCIIRLHIREVTNNGQPGREILRDSIAQAINKSPNSDNYYEFDLNRYNIILSQQNIFVSFEVLEGTKADKTSRSLTFVGSDLGSYLYKSTETDSWHSSDEYTIFMKLVLKYDE
jgi:hypothetical protein